MSKRKQRIRNENHSNKGSALLETTSLVELIPRRNSNAIEEDADIEHSTVDKEFLKEVYNQCNNIYLSFVNFRFQLMALFVSSAALFVFAFEKRNSLKLDILVSMTAIFLTWVIFFVDRRNRHIFKRVIEKARLIEIYFNVPEEMRIHSKSKRDLNNKISHSLLFLLTTLSITGFWIVFLLYCFWRY